jgi:hypothetical protein
MATDFQRGDHVEWNSEAGRARGTIQRKVTSEIIFKGYRRHASKLEPQYIIKSDKTDHVAIHKGSALKKIKRRTRFPTQPRQGLGVRKPAIMQSDVVRARHEQLTKRTELNNLQPKPSDYQVKDQGGGRDKDAGYHQSAPGTVGNVQPTNPAQDGHAQHHSQRCPPIRQCSQEAEEKGGNAKRLVGRIYAFRNHSHGPPLQLNSCLEN